jgi:hypothetical protein
MIITELNTTEFLSEVFTTGSVHTRNINDIEQTLIVKSIFKIENETFIVYSYQDGTVKDQKLLIGTRRTKTLKYHVMDLPGFYQIIFPEAPNRVEYISGSGVDFIPDITQ